jgi:ABC-2 type transport system ATP-binding protein
VIQVNNLSKSFYTNKKHEGFRGAIKSLFSNEIIEKTAVDNISFNIAKGEVVGYIGLNGAGKSTTIKIMTGLMLPTSGECIVNGVLPYKNRKTYTQNIGVVFGQRTQLWWDLPVSESFGILKKIYSIPDKEYKESLQDLKELLDLEEFYLTPVRNLSLGQKMRADLAAALLHKPSIIFLDEPTIGLDIFVKSKIRNAIKEINRLNKTTVILTTHDLDDIQEICNRILVIDKGRIIFDGTMSDIQNKFATFRRVVFDIKETRNHNINSAFQIGAEDMQVEENDNKLIIKYNKDLLEVKNLISYVIQNYNVKDITIQEPQMEDIVKEIYTAGSNI